MSKFVAIIEGQVIKTALTSVKPTTTGGAVSAPPTYHAHAGVSNTTTKLVYSLASGGITTLTTTEKS